MSPVVIVAFALIFVALLLVFGAVGGIFKERPGVNRSIAVLEALTSAPGGDEGRARPELQPTGCCSPCWPAASAWAGD